MSKLNFSANVTRGTKSMTLKLLNKISAFVSQFVLYVTCAKQVSKKSIIVYAVALCPADAKRFRRCLKVSILSRISSKYFIPFAVYSFGRLWSSDSDKGGGFADDHFYEFGQSIQSVGTKSKRKACYGILFSSLFYEAV